MIYLRINKIVFLFLAIYTLFSVCIPVYAEDVQSTYKVGDFYDWLLYVSVNTVEEIPLIGPLILSSSSNSSEDICNK